MSDAYGLDDLSQAVAMEELVAIDPCASGLLSAEEEQQLAAAHTQLQQLASIPDIYGDEVRSMTRSLRSSQRQLRFPKCVLAIVSSAVASGPVPRRTTYVPNSAAPAPLACDPQSPPCHTGQSIALVLHVTTCRLLSKASSSRWRRSAGLSDLAASPAPRPRVGRASQAGQAEVVWPERTARQVRPERQTPTQPLKSRKSRVGAMNG